MATDRLNALQTLSGVVAERWGLTRAEVLAFRRYLRGQQTCAEYDALTPVLQAAVNDLTDVQSRVPALGLK